MKNHLVRRGVAGFTLGALAAFGLASVPSPAHAAVEEGQVGGQYDIYGYDCEGEGGWNDPDIAPWTDNSVPVSKSTSFSDTFTGEEGDTVQATTSTNASITASPIGSGPATITGTATATASTVASGSETQCDVNVNATAMATGIFTLAQPMWVVLTAKGNGQRQGQAFGTSVVAIGSVGMMGESWAGLYGLGGDGLTVAAGNRGSAVSSTLLPAGRYGVAMGSMAYAATNDYIEEGELVDDVDGTASYTGTFQIDLKPVGSASEVSGKGAGLVSFGARDCANGNVAAGISKKLAKKAKRVVVKVNGTKVAKFKGKKLKKLKKKPLVLATPVASTVKVKVKMKMENGRRFRAVRTYLPCS